MAKDKKEKTLILIDSHGILHRAFHALPNFTSPSGEPTGALYGFTVMLLKIIKELNPDYIAACYDLPEPTFRHLFYEKYKAQRPAMSKELSVQIENSRKILEVFGIPVYEAPGFEADDVLATIVQKIAPDGKEKNANVKIIIVSGDLDSLMLVRKGVDVCMMKKGIQETVSYNEKTVRERFGFSPKLLPDFKGLKGDPSDNIVGVKGIGETTAKLLIKNFGDLTKLFNVLKKDKGKLEAVGIKPRIIQLLLENEEEAFFSKSLVEARTDVPVDFSFNSADWNNGFNKEKAEKLLRDYGFRSVLSRLPMGRENLSVQSANQDELPSEITYESKELQVMFWLLDSRRINPNVEDILAFSRTGSLIEAKKFLEKKIKEDGLFKIFSEIEQPLIDILARIEKKGITLDIEYLNNLSKDYHGKLELIEEKIRQATGEKFNVNSPKQLSDVLFNKLNVSNKGVRRTKIGVYSTDFSALEKIRDRHPVIEEVIAYRELFKLVSTYVDTLPLLAKEDRRLHTSFNQTGTTTGRLSSSEPNLQNIPIKSDFGKAVRKAFVAPNGWSLVSFDYSQIELRIAAFLSGDDKMRSAFKNGEDIHTKVASEVFNVSFDQVTSEMRRKAKVINFGIIYGMGLNALSKNLNCSKEEASIFYNEYFNDFSGMKDYIEKIKKDTLVNGYTSTFLGRRRYFPEIHSSIDYIRKEAERMAINAPIQGAATGDIIKTAMVRTDSFLRQNNFLEEARLLLQVHDELLFEIKNDTIKKVIPFIKTIMEDFPFIDVPLIVGISRGDNWADMKKINL